MISYNGTPIDLGKPFARLTMIDAIKQYAGIDFDQVKTDEEAKALADQHKIEYEARHKRGDIINMFMRSTVRISYSVDIHYGSLRLRFLRLQRRNPKIPIMLRDLSSL